MPYRMYAVSISAIRRAQPPETHGIFAHRGLVCIAESVEAAGQQSKAYVYQAFPISQGYSLHTAVVVPVERDFLVGLQSAINAGQFVSEANEETRTFNFESDIPGDFNFDGDVH